MLERDSVDGVEIVRFARGKVNALDLELLQEVIATFAQLLDEDVDAVVLTGRGSAFSAGVDLHRVLEGRAEYLADYLPAMAEAFESVFRFPRPVVAAVNGHAIAGGCIFACACDRRLMAEGDHRIGVTELDVGVAFPTAAMEILRFSAGHHTEDLVYSAETFSPKEAVDKGLVDVVAPAADLLDRAVGEAQHLAAIPRATFAVTKRQLRRDAFDAINVNAAHDDAQVADIWASAQALEMMSVFTEERVGRSRS